MADLTAREEGLAESITSTTNTLNSDLAQALSNLQLIALDLQRPASADPALGNNAVALQSIAGALQKHTLHLREMIDPLRSVLRPERFYQAGVVAAADKQFERAAGFFRRALELRTEYPEAHKALGDVLSKLGKLEDAVVCYERALALKPDFAEAHNNLGNVLQTQGKLEDAAGPSGGDLCESVRKLAGLPELVRGADVARQWGATATAQSLKSCAPVLGQDDSPNPLRAYFDAIKEGAGVWKWLHYFEIYHRHLHKFIGRQVTIVEVGVYSGGSMPMWRHYFGEGCRVHGVDIQEECKVYEDSHTTIHIGDQADRAFWKRFQESVPTVDVLIDDGGHEPEQQMVTLEEMLPHLRPGGIYICEDVHGIGNRFTIFAHSLADELNAFAPASQQELASTPTPFQATVNSVHLYPFVVVIEKRDAILTSFSAPKHGTKWQPFFKTS